ncbi:related to RVS167-BAR adaptor protein [Serendipita indica DSM 11827]|uniref:Related to RVS167-BAR adaptor protein n=1 Tax=Serendipita indica (strain DSM 11827) TaxID=1109443 RepID=G4TDK9_SERID|nr:related to RVS167-BAR adaptor protein [Serendipita indica DSM 11827]
MKGAPLMMLGSPEADICPSHSTSFALFSSGYHYFDNTWTNRHSALCAAYAASADVQSRLVQESVLSRLAVAESNDPEFDEFARNFEVMEKAVEALLKDSKVFADNVIILLESGAKFGEGFANLFHPLPGEYDLLRQHPEAEKTVKSVDKYTTAMQELRDTLAPELELIASRIIEPTKEFQAVMKTIRKNITKREHKLVDYDRHNNSLTKLREKKDKSLSDEKNLFKLEQEFDVATQEYEAINTALKADLPQFMVLATRFIDPLFHSFYYMQ